MEEPDSSLDPESEVKKLQDLVRKLERQNEILRTKQNAESPQTQDINMSISDFENQNTALDFLDKPITKPKYSLTGSNSNCTVRSGSLSLENVDLIDVEMSFENGDEEDWLYKSPKALSPSQKSQTPYKWLREEFESPSPDIESCKRTLFYKLEEVVRGGVSRSSSSHTLGSLSSPINAPVNALGDATNTPRTVNGIPAIKQPLVAGLVSDISISLNGVDISHGAGDTDVDLSPDSIWSDIPEVSDNGTRVDTGTFTRPKKGRPRISENNYLNNVTTRSPSETNGSENGADRKPETTILDVQTLAKMQEDSLRQSFSPMVGSRRSSRSRIGGGFYLSNQNDDGMSSHSSNRSSPCRFDSDAHFTPRPRKSSLNSRTSSNNSLNSGSNESSPSESPYSSNQYLEQPSSGVPRRSLPNLKSGVGLRPNYSDSKLSHMRRATSPAQVNKTIRGPAGRISPASSSGRMSPSGERTTPMSGLRQPNRTSSPNNRRGIPSPKKIGVIPRPLGSLTPTKRGIPMPRSSLSGTPGNRSISPNSQKRSSMSSLPVTAYRKNISYNDNDDSWKDGCF